MRILHIVLATMSIRALQARESAGAYYRTAVLTRDISFSAPA
jgi:hypothetical protein